MTRKTFNSEICKICSISFIPTGSRQKYCKECAVERKRESDRKWRAENPEKVKKNRKGWAENNPEKNREKNRKWVKNNPEKCRNNSTKYREKNREKINMAAKTNLKKLYNENRQMALVYKGGKCVVTGKTDDIEFHHLNPDEKEANVSQLFRSQWDVIKAELDKCIPLTMKVHRKLHRKLHKIKAIN